MPTYSFSNTYAPTSNIPDSSSLTLRTYFASVRFFSFFINKIECQPTMPRKINVLPVVYTCYDVSLPFVDVISSFYNSAYLNVKCSCITSYMYTFIRPYHDRRSPFFVKIVHNCPNFQLNVHVYSFIFTINSHTSTFTHVHYLVM